MGYLHFPHLLWWLNEWCPHLSEESNFAVSIVWDLDCVNLIRGGLDLNEYEEVSGKNYISL